MLNVSYNCYSLQSERKETPDLRPQRGILKGHTSCCFIIPESVEAVSSPWMCARCDAQGERSVWPIHSAATGWMSACTLTLCPRHALRSHDLLITAMLYSVRGESGMLSVGRTVGAVYYYYLFISGSSSSSSIYI